MIKPSKLEKFKPNPKELEKLGNEFFSEALPLLDEIYNASPLIFLDDKAAAKISKQIFYEAIEYCHVTKNEADWQSWIYRIWMRDVNGFFVQRENDIKTNFEFIDYAKVESNEGWSVGDLNQLKKLLYKLPAMLRIPLVMKEVLSFSYEKIAELVDVPVGVIATRLYRARKLLFMLSRNDFDLANEKIIWNQKEPTKKIFDLRKSSQLVDEELNPEEKLAVKETSNTNNEFKSEIILQKSVKNSLQTKIPATLPIDSLKLKIERKAKKKFRKSIR